MAEEKQTPEPIEVNDTLTSDDISVLREVLEDTHSRGITPVSIYKQDELVPDDFAE